MQPSDRVIAALRSLLHMEDDGKMGVKNPEIGEGKVNHVFAGNKSSPITSQKCLSGRRKSVSPFPSESEHKDVTSPAEGRHRSESGLLGNYFSSLNVYSGSLWSLFGFT
ncbi:hypothetical protein CDAR_54401 [Caerostris darwini]|uniref:Uncharacterized protein n=1 Tax=Caerostris darwini TaxID=1538125 RepID=A0AAV4TJ53_9ARAC|nr:hypothetical protein CDAR_54401 [Caerostris darwini]